MISDPHVHLYGRLTAEDLFDLSKDRLRDEKRLTWFAQQYELAFDKTPKWDRFFSSGTSGFDEFKSCYEITTKLKSFAQFQAKINLAIALFPLSATEHPILERALERDEAEGIHRVEYRSFLPDYADEAFLEKYLSSMCEALQKFEKRDFEPRVALSMTRTAPHFERLFQFLRSFMQRRPVIAKYISGIDFCAAEECDEPEDKAPFFSTVLKHNRDVPDQELQLLVHVGETWESTSLPTAIRRVVQAALGGAHRLGHALALGVDASNMAGKQVEEPAPVRQRMVQWILKNHKLLRAFGVDLDLKQWQQEEQSQTPSSYTYTPDQIAFCSQLQQAARRIILTAAPQCVIECCPTSNVMIGGLSSLEKHPIKTFLRDGLKVLVGSDDPGMLKTSLARELEIARRIIT